MLVGKPNQHVSREIGPRNVFFEKGGVKRGLFCSYPAGVCMRPFIDPYHSLSGSFILDPELFYFCEFFCGTP